VRGWWIWVVDYGLWIVELWMGGAASTFDWFYHVW